MKSVKSELLVLLNLVITPASTAKIAVGAVLHWPWTPAIVVFVLLGGPLMWISREHRRWKGGWLSGLIDARLIDARLVSARKRPAPEAAAQGPIRIGWRTILARTRLDVLETWDDMATYLRKTLPANIRDLHLPSVVSFLVVAVLIAVFFIISRPPSLMIALHAGWLDWWHILTDDLESSDGKTGELIVGAFAGLVVVVIALIVFVAESIRDDRDLERKRVLLRIGWLWPLGVAATLIPFGFLWAAARGFTILLEVIVAVLTLIAFGRVIHNLLDPETRARNRAALLRERMHRMIFASLRERAGNSILLEQLGTGKTISALHYTVSHVWMEHGAQTYLFIDAPQDGWLADIQIAELGVLVDKLDRYARDVLGFGLKPSGPTLQPGTLDGGPPAMTESRFPTRTAYLMKRFGEEVPPTSIFYGRRRALFALPKEFERNPALLMEIRAAIPHIFRFTQDEPSSVVFRRELQATKDQLAGAIRARALGAIDDLRQTYLTVAEEFLTLLADYGGGYSAEQAEKERGNLFEGWTEIHWLQSDLRELIIIAADTGNTDVMGSIMFLPFAVTSRAVLAKDLFLFQQFLTFALLLYFLAEQRGEDTAARAWLIDKAWRYPKEIAEFYVARQLEDAESTVADLEQMRGFALYSFRVFQDLLKAAVDKRDIATFTTVATELKQLYTGFRANEDQPNADILRMQLDRAESDTERASLTEQLALQEKRNDIAAHLTRAVDQIFLALGGWILGQRLAAPDDARIADLLGAVRTLLPGELKALTSVYADASGFRTSDYWGWDGWGLVADGQVHYVDVHTKLNQIYTLRALELLATMSEDARDAIGLLSSSGLGELARESNEQGLSATFNDIDANRLRWQPVLSEQARTFLPKLRDCLAVMREAERASEAERTRNATLDPMKVVEFRNEVTKRFAGGGRLRRILAAKGAVEMRLDKHPRAQVPSVGYNQIDDKKVFITQDRTAYVGWGESYGQGLAHGEDEVAFAAMTAGAGVQRRVERGTVVETINAIVSDDAMKDVIVLQSLEFNMENEEIRKSPAFTSKYDPKFQSSPLKDLSGFMGEMIFGEQRIVVFDAFVRRPESQNKVLIMNMHKYLRWRQFAPDDVPEEAEHIFGTLLVRVTDLNQDAALRDRIIAEHPPWLEQEADKIALLRSRVLVKVYEKFSVDILTAKAGVCLTLAARDSDA